MVLVPFRDPEDLILRLRPLALLSAAAMAALAVTGCASSSAPDTDPKPTGSADVCSQVAAPGAVSDSVKVTGDFGEPAEVTFDKKQEVTEVQRTVVTEGTGTTITEGDYVSYAMSAFDSETGKKLGDLGYEDAELLPQNVLANQALAQIIGCATVGTRVAVALPAAQTTGAQVYVIDVLADVPTAAWGEQQKPVAGMPKVSLAKNGEPKVTIPKADAPTDLKIEVLKQGDGPKVADGDTTLLQYYGVSWADGKTFDSSWKNSEPISLPGNTYVPGFVQALAGQKVGSQVLVVIPPKLAYGEDPKAHELGGQTLTFVIDILATEHVPSAAE